MSKSRSSRHGETARALREGVPLRRTQSGAYPAQVEEARDEGNEEVHVLEAKEASDDEGHRKDDNDCPAKVKAFDWRKPKSFQFPPSRATSLSREREQGATTSTLSDGQGAFARALDEGVCITPGTKEDCSSKLVGKLCTVSCVSGDSNSVDLPQIFLCESNESLSHILGPDNFTCVADVCSYVPNLDDSVVSDCGDTHLRTGDTGTARCAPGALYSVSEIPSKRSLASQMVLCQEHSLSASLCHVQHQRLIQSTVWTCTSFTVRMREVAWSHVRTAIPWWEIRLYGLV